MRRLADGASEISSSPSSKAPRGRDMIAMYEYHSKSRRKWSRLKWDSMRLYYRDCPTRESVDAQVGQELVAKMLRASELSP